MGSGGLIVFGLPRHSAKIGFTVVATLLCLATASPTTAQESDDGAADEVAFDIETGAESYKKTCRRCHGPTAKGLASFPKLVGQTQEYLSDKLQRYRNGEKLGPNTGLMAPVAKELSDQEILDITHFIASLG